MAHYAFLNENNIVTEVIVGKDEDDLETLPEGFTSWEEWYQDFRKQTCKRTSYNTLGNIHLENGTPFRGNYAGIGFIYDATNDVFVSPKPYNSWVLNETTWLWEAPVNLPADNDTVPYEWNEDTQSWDIAT
jgi:hypothetical protein